MNEYRHTFVRIWNKIELIEGFYGFFYSRMSMCIEFIKSCMEEFKWYMDNGSIELTRSTSKAVAADGNLEGSKLSLEKFIQNLFSELHNK